MEAGGLLFWCEILLRHLTAVMFWSQMRPVLDLLTELLHHFVFTLLFTVLSLIDLNTLLINTVLWKQPMYI